jgi:hypothetical protein
MNVYSNPNSKKLKYVSAIGPLAPGGLETLEEKDIKPFIEDCYYIRQEIMIFRVFAIHRRQGPLQENYPELKVRPNQAVLRQRPTAKEPPPPRLPSIPKLSVAQKRAKALKDARPKAAKNS